MVDHLEPLAANFSLQKGIASEILSYRQAWVNISPYLHILLHKPTASGFSPCISRRDTRGFPAWEECPKDQGLLVARVLLLPGRLVWPLISNLFCHVVLMDLASLLHGCNLTLCLSPVWLLSLPIRPLSLPLPRTPASPSTKRQFPTSKPLVLPSPWAWLNCSILQKNYIVHPFQPILFLALGSDPWLSPPDVAVCTVFANPFCLCWYYWYHVHMYKPYDSAVLLQIYIQKNWKQEHKQISVHECS